MFSAIAKFCIFNLLICINVFVIAEPNGENDKDVEPNEMQLGTTEQTLTEDKNEEINEKEKEPEVGEDTGKELEEKNEEPSNEGGSKPSEDEEEEESKLDVEKEKEGENIEESTSGSEDKEETDEERKEKEPVELSSAAPEETISEKNVEIPSSAPPMVVTDTSVEKEEAPIDTYAVWNSKGKICLLAKINATFTIIYASKTGDEKAQVPMPPNGNFKGKCESTSRSPLLQISWEKYVLTLMFNRTSEEEWSLTTMELTYDTSVPLFDGAVNAGKKTARSKSLKLFETPMGKSYYCSAQEVVLLYSANKQVVTARLKETYVQPYGVEDGKFSPAHRCNKVLIDGLEQGPFVQDETVPLAVGCTLALITLIILIGFSVHRAYNAAKVDYNTME